MQPEPLFQQKQRSSSLPSVTTTATLDISTQFPLPPTNKYSHLPSHSLKFSLPVETIYETPEAAASSTRSSTVDFFENTLQVTATITAASKQQHQLDIQVQQSEGNQFMLPPLGLDSGDSIFGDLMDFGGGGGRIGGGFMEEDWSSITSTVVMGDGASGFSVPPGLLTGNGSGSGGGVRW